MNSTKFKRRDFFKLAAATAAGLATGQTLGASAKPIDLPSPLSLSTSEEQFVPARVLAAAVPV